jgi:cysteine desulfurase
MMRLLFSALSALLVMPARCLMSSLAGFSLRRVAVDSRAAPTATASTGVVRCEVGSPLPPTPGAEGCVYFDYAATCPIYPDVAAAMLPYFSTQWGNPSSPHAFGRQTKLACDGARARVAELLDCAPSEVIFTSCGSESNNWAIVSAVELARDWLAPDELPHIVTSTIEHPAITLCVDALVAQGRATATKVGVDSWGRVDPADVAAAMRPTTALVTIMHANNEVGTLQPIAAITAAARAASARVLVHTDAAQSVGRVPVSIGALGVDMLTLVGHKFGAPKGCAALFVRDGLVLPNLLRGGGQELGRRAGTECVPLIVGLGEASAIWNEQGRAIAAHSAAMRARLLVALEARLGADRLRDNSPLHHAPPVAGDEWSSLPNVLSVGVRGVPSGAVLTALATCVAASAGAACHSHASGAVSGVLGELGVPREFALGTLRLSVGRHTTADEVDLAAALIAEAVLAADASDRT